MCNFCVSLVVQFCCFYSIYIYIVLHDIENINMCQFDSVCIYIYDVCVFCCIFTIHRMASPQQKVAEILETTIVEN